MTDVLDRIAHLPPELREIILRYHIIIDRTNRKKDSIEMIKKKPAWKILEKNGLCVKKIPRARTFIRIEAHSAQVQRKNFITGRFWESNKNSND